MRYAPSVIGPEATIKCRGNVGYGEFRAFKALGNVLCVALEEMNNAADDDDDDGQQLSCGEYVLCACSKIHTVAVDIGYSHYQSVSTVHHVTVFCIAITYR